MSKLLTLILLAIVFSVGLVLLGNAIDNSIDRQNTMLCRSAKISLNSEYLIKCQQYYDSGDIKYLRTK